MPFSDGQLFRLHGDVDEAGVDHVPRQFRSDSWIFVVPFQSPTIDVPPS